MPTSWTVGTKWYNTGASILNDLTNPGGALGALVNIPLAPVANTTLPLGQRLTTEAVAANFANDVLQPWENFTNWIIQTGQKNLFDGKQPNEE